MAVGVMVVRVGPLGPSRGGLTYKRGQDEHCHARTGQAQMEGTASHGLLLLLGTLWPLNASCCGTHPDFWRAIRFYELSDTLPHSHQMFQESPGAMYCYAI